jgi:hypothetical protein
VTEQSRHYFVTPKRWATAGKSPREMAILGCARKGCGLPPAHPIHIKPSARVSLERAATG